MCYYIFKVKAYPSKSLVRYLENLIQKSKKLRCFFMADKMVNLNIRVSENDRANFDKICNSLGISMSSALNMYIKSVIRNEKIEFELKPTNENK